MRYLFVAVFFSLLLAGSFLFWHNKISPYSIVKTSDRSSLQQNIEETGTIFLVGDIMLDRGVEYYIRKNQDWKWPFLKIADVLQQADLVFANLESVISDKGTSQGSIYSFRADPQAMESLVFAGIDVVSVANNHSLDYGLEAFGDSLNRLKNAGISPIGGDFSKTEARSPVIKEVRGTKVGFLAYTNAGSSLWQATENTPGIAWVDQDSLLEFQEDIKNAKEKADILIVSLHFGEEYQKEPNTTQTLISKTAIDAGADLVVGHHPHVVQPIEPYKQGWIAYSLGNFVFDQGFSPETMEGMLFEVVVQDKKITRVSPRPIYLNSEFQPSFQNLAE